MPNPKQEEFCIDELKTWLRHFSRSKVTWERGPDPPDFWLWHNTEKYAVEVTRIIHRRDRELRASQWHVVEQAETIALKAGELKGYYLVIFQRPLEHKVHRKQLLESILRFVRRTGPMPAGPREEITVDHRVICEISKIEGAVDAIEPVDGGLDLGGWEGDVRCELTEILQHSLEAKAKRQRKVDVPVILVLYDLYRLAQKDLFCACLLACPQAKQFHSIFVVLDKGSGYAASTGFSFARNGWMDTASEVPGAARKL